jgi:hypothetical protein
MDNLAAREMTLQGNHVVELEIAGRIDAHPELEGGRIFGADDPADWSHIHLFQFHFGRGYQRGVTGPGTGGPT